MWRFLVLLSLSHNVFWVRCGNNCIDSSHLPSSLLFILTRVPTHKKKTVYCVILSDQIVVGCPLGVPITYYPLSMRAANARIHRLAWASVVRQDLLCCLKALSHYNVLANVRRRMKYVEDIYFFEVNTKYISSSAVKKTVFFTSA